MLPTNRADTARPPRAPNKGLAPLAPCEDEPPEAWPEEPVDEATPPESVVVPAMSRSARVSDVIAGQERRPTLLKVGERIVGLDVGLGYVCGDAHGDEVLEGSLELVVKVHGLGHGEVVEFMGEHDGTTLGGVSECTRWRRWVRTVAKVPF
jgi:hypothetical protein